MNGDTGLSVGMTGRATVAVSPENTARAAGSGNADVFATPALIALMEAAAVDCVERHLAAGQISLGTHLDVAHGAATPVGHEIAAVAELVGIDGRKLSFRVEARDPFEVISQGTHTRVVVDAKRFEAKLGSKSA